MAVQDKPTLKGYFNTGDVPTEQNYADLIDSMGDGDMKKSVYDTDNDGKVESADISDRVDWSGVQNKPVSYPPSGHTHAGGDITSQVSNANTANNIGGYGGSLGPDGNTVAIRDASGYLHSQYVRTPGAGDPGGAVGGVFVTVPSADGGAKYHYLVSPSRIPGYFVGFTQSAPWPNFLQGQSRGAGDTAYYAITNFQNVPSSARHLLLSLSFRSAVNGTYIFVSSNSTYLDCIGSRSLSSTVSVETMGIVTVQNGAIYIKFSADCSAVWLTCWGYWV